ncbi:hypothetical protein IQ16_05931 [Bradyrhizobium huanghuaihaiense]|uniref:Uncharacterized protein n=1 Tax=Bradyrhizobium huanghuaihaiense TaxID=990078 RepID=A0A562R4S8_9BRAD|nr:hypothetical protein IQ16_05931 [Bradyrhizobium huanghuaihaiense]
MQSIARGASKDERPGCSRAVALRGPLKKRPPQGDGLALVLRDGTESYCASARIPPANACHAAVSLIGQFSTFTASSASVP